MPLGNYIGSLLLKSGGLSASVSGSGAGGTQTESLSTRPDALILDGSRVVRYLVRGFLRLVQPPAFPSSCVGRAIKIPYFPVPGTINHELADMGDGSRV